MCAGGSNLCSYNDGLSVLKLVWLLELVLSLAAPLLLHLILSLSFCSDQTRRAMLEGRCSAPSLARRLCLSALYELLRQLFARLEEY